MQKKFISAPAALVAALLFAAGPVIADEVAPDDVTAACADDAHTDQRVDDSNDPASDLDEITEAAEDAAEAVADIGEEEETDADDDCVSGHDRAEESLKAAIDRLEADGAGGNGVASEILAALMAGDSPAGIGAEHGKDMAQAAAQARLARQAEHQAERDSEGPGGSDDAGRPDHAGRPESSVDDDADESVDDDANESVDDESVDELTDDQDESDAGPGESEGKGRP